MVGNFVAMAHPCAIPSPVQLGRVAQFLLPSLEPERAKQNIFAMFSSACALTDNWILSHLT